MVLQGGASELANLVNITPMSLGFMEDIYIYIQIYTLVGGLEHFFFVHILGSS